MSGFKDIVKGGWHPEKKREGYSSSSGSSNVGLNKVKGLVGRGGGGGDAATAAQNHQSAPLTTLVDPASFGPPPKHIHYHGAAAAGATSNAARPPPPRVPQHPSHPSPTATGPPRLPPRLPPRQNSNPHELTPNPPPPYSEINTTVPAPPPAGQLNQGALNRLGNAGVNVPGFNIGSSASPPVPPRQSTSPAPLSPTATNNGPHLGELQSRFSKMTSPSSEPPSTGTTWAQKQAALKTAGNLRKDPSKVSVSDMRSAASTANNFRERHGEQAAAGWKTANGLNQKYGISNKVGGFAGSSSSASASGQPATPTSPIGKKPPPPPPKKKGLAGNAAAAAAEASEPPPVPLSSKPKF